MPALTAMAVVMPATATGVALSVVVPSPSWPDVSVPQQRTVWSASRAHEESLPALTETAVVMPTTATGVEAAACVPSPSFPALFEPQQATVPSSRRPQAWFSPELTCVKPDARWHRTRTALPRVR